MFFTTLKVEEGKPLFFDRHIKHFLHHLKCASITPPLFPLQHLINFLKRESQKTQNERLNLFFEPPTKWTFKLTQEKALSKKHLNLAEFPFPFYEPYPQLKKKPFGRLDLLHEAKKKKYDDWIFRDNNSHVLETSIANLFWILENQLFYPAPSLPYYVGVTLSLALEACEGLELRPRPSCSKVRALFEADEVLYCNSMKGFMRVRSINGRDLEQRSGYGKELNRWIEKQAREEDVLLKSDRVHLQVN